MSFLQGLLNYLHKGRETNTNAWKSISLYQSSINDGEGFSISGLFTAVADSATVNYAFKTPTVASGKVIHLPYREFWGNGNKIRTDLYEAPTNAPINGSDLAVINRNRVGTPTVTTMQAVKAAMDIDLTGATDLETLQFGYAVTTRPLDVKFILKPDTWYIRTFTNSTGGAVNINFFDSWSEK